MRALSWVLHWKMTDKHGAFGGLWLPVVPPKFWKVLFHMVRRGPYTLMVWLKCRRSFILATDETLVGNSGAKHFWKLVSHSRLHFHWLQSLRFSTEIPSHSQARGHTSSSSAASNTWDFCVAANEVCPTRSRTPKNVYGLWYFEVMRPYFSTSKLTILGCVCIYMCVYVYPPILLDNPILLIHENLLIQFNKEFQNSDAFHLVGWGQRWPGSKMQLPTPSRRGPWSSWPSWATAPARPSSRTSSWPSWRNVEMSMEILVKYMNDSHAWWIHGYWTWC